MCALKLPILVLLGKFIETQIRLLDIFDHRRCIQRPLPGAHSVPAQRIVLTDFSRCAILANLDLGLALAVNHRIGLHAV